MKHLIALLSFLILAGSAFSQAVPASDENIPYLVTFGPKAEQSWGDDDFSQVFFFVIPKTHKTPVFIRVFDPGVGGKLDEKRGEFNTKIEYTVYGGKGCISHDDSKNVDPTGSYKTGTQLATKTFGTELDEKWHSFGPFNPTSGELMEKYGGYVFKVIAEGIHGDDGNLYRYFMSTSNTRNQAIEGGNAFAFEYTFRMHDDPKEVSHVYPYIDEQVISIKQGNFDWDRDGELKIITNTRLAVHLEKSGDAVWQSSVHNVLQKEKESTFDVQFHKNKTSPISSNNVAFYITNQYGTALPFFVIPIGGIPKPQASIKLIPKKK
jgi:hypothetical protein